MSAPRSPVIFALFSAIESTYNTANAPTADGWVITTEAPSFEEAFINDGARGLDNRSAGDLANTRMSGREYTIGLTNQMRGRPAALTSGTPPLGWHNWMRSAGFAAAFSGGAWTYTPASGSYASMTADAFKHGLTSSPGTFLRYRATGVYTESVTISAEAGGIVQASFSAKGAGLVPTEEALIDLSAADVATGPYKFDGSNTAANLISWGASNWTPVIASFEYTMERELTQRPSGNTPLAHAGFSPGRRTAHSIVMKVEATDLATYNPFTLKQTQTPHSIDLRCGSSADGDKLQILATSTAQLVEVAEEAEGGVSYWSLTFKLNGGASGNNDVSLIAS